MENAYEVKLNGEVVGTRKSDREYTHTLADRLGAFKR